MKRFFAAAMLVVIGVLMTSVAFAKHMHNKSGSDASADHVICKMTHPWPFGCSHATYAVAKTTSGDADGDGVADILNPADAIYTAARYLCANGAGRGEEATARAVWHYNHADWYVALVLKLAGQYAARDAG